MSVRGFGCIVKSRIRKCFFHGYRLCAAELAPSRGRRLYYLARSMAKQLHLPGPYLAKIPPEPGAGGGSWNRFADLKGASMARSAQEVTVGEVVEPWRAPAPCMAVSWALGLRPGQSLSPAFRLEPSEAQMGASMTEGLHPGSAAPQQAQQAPGSGARAGLDGSGGAMVQGNRGGRWLWMAAGRWLRSSSWPSGLGEGRAASRRCHRGWETDPAVWGRSFRGNTQSWRGGPGYGDGRPRLRCRPYKWGGLARRRREVRSSSIAGLAGGATVEQRDIPVGSNCHEPNTMAIRLTSQAFWRPCPARRHRRGQALSYQELKTYVCAQCPYAASSLGSGKTVLPFTAEGDRRAV